jgi:hypothetical protein
MKNPADISDSEAVRQLIKTQLLKFSGHQIFRHGALAVVWNVFAEHVHQKATLVELVNPFIKIFKSIKVKMQFHI